jgi:3-hydroxyisobutyrate dehydrogenase-like beta-hydroxyacid dehydrogenase
MHKKNKVNMNLGFIGLGHLGTPIALNLLEQVGQLYVYNRTASKMEALREKGANPCSSVKELASHSDMVFTIVSDDLALKEITLGEEGLAAHLNPGGIHVSMSTITPQTAEQLSQRHALHQQHYVAAPVMGRPAAAESRKLNFLLSGDPAITEKVKPYLNYGGATAIWEFGEKVAAANVVKLCNNFLIASAIESLAEAMQLAELSGLDKQKWVEMITQSLFNAPVFHTYSEVLLKEAYQPAQFSLLLGLKDINLVLDQAVLVRTPMPVAEQLKKQMEACVARGWGEYDWAAMALALQ